MAASRPTPTGPNGRWTYNDLVSLAKWGGFPDQVAPTMASIALAESGGNATIFSKPNTNGTIDRGLWQINTVHKQFADGAMRDPYQNVRAAAAIYNSQGLHAWSTYNNGAYLHTAPQGAAVANNNGGPGAQPAAVVQPTVDRKELQAQYGYADAFFRDPELGKLVDKATASGWTADRFKAALLNTNWYRTRTDAQRNWFQIQSTDPRSAERQVQLKTADIVRLAVADGVQLAPGVAQQMATDALKNGLDDAHLRYAIDSHLTYKSGQNLGGTPGQTFDAYTTYAQEMGVPIAHDAVGAWAVRTHQGQATDEDFHNYIKDQAKSLYPGYAAQLDNTNMTVQKLAAPYMAAKANLLEVPQDTIGLTDQTVKQALQYRDPATKDGSFTAMPLWQFEQQVKQDPAWQKTQNAHDSYDQAVQHVGRDWGFL